MGSLPFPFSFSQPPHNAPRSPASSSFPAAVTASLVAAVTAGGRVCSAISNNIKNPADPFLQKALDFLSSNAVCGFPSWASLSLADASGGIALETKTGVSFPKLLKDSQRLLGIGLRKKNVMGLKSIDVYAFGVYADGQEIKELMGEKFSNCSVSELKENNEFNSEILDQDLSMTVRLQIVYGRLSIRSVRNAFEESIGSRLKKFGGLDQKELLERFTSQFKDEYKLPRGSIIDLSRERGYILRTAIDGKEIGSIQSKLLCKSILDLYIGDDPLDRRAKEDVGLGLASFLRD